MAKVFKNNHNSQKQNKYKFGVKIPIGLRQALKFDKENGNNVWGQAIEKELQGLMDMKTFTVLCNFNDIPKD